LNLQANKGQAHMWVNIKTSVSLECDKCYNVIDVKSVNPFMVCPKCNGRFHLENCLIGKYTKSKKFKSTPPTASKYVYNLIPFCSDIGGDNVSHSIVSLNEGYSP
jgi:hypothetical protein